MSEDTICYYDFGEYRLDIINYQLLKNGQPIQLTQKSFEILQALIENRNRMLKKEELLELVWADCYVEEATLTQHIYMLRKALKDNGKDVVFIETIPKNGYRFVADVSEIFQINGFSKPIRPAVENDPPVSQSNFQQTFQEKIEKKDENLSIDHGKAVPPRNKFPPVVWIPLGILVILAGIALFYFLQKSNNPNPITNLAQIKSIAVLPFKQIDQEKDEKLGLGMADVLITKLGNFETLEVLPTSSIVNYAYEENIDLFEVGTKLEVDAILAGTIQKDADKIRVTVQLYNVRDKKPLFTDQFDEKYSDIFSLQDRISERVSNKLALKIKNPHEIQPNTLYTKNVEAYQAYSIGLYYWSKHTMQGFKEALGHFQRAIDHDPNFVLAYAHLSDTYGHYHHIADIVPHDEAISKAKQLAEKALELDPLCSEAMASLALVYISENRQKEAYDLLKRSIELKPNNSNAHQRLARLYANWGKIEDALQEMSLAQIHDTQSVYVNISMAEFLNLAKRPDEAIGYSKRVLELDAKSVWAKWELARSLEQKGKYDEAIGEFQEIAKLENKSTSVELSLSRIYAKNQKKEESRKILKETIDAGKAKNHKYLVALNYLALGESEKALGWLKESAIATDPELFYILKFESNLDPLRNNPEFQRILSEAEKKQHVSG